jgi:hypothetical protein
MSTSKGYTYQNKYNIVRACYFEPSGRCVFVNEIPALLHHVEGAPILNCPWSAQGSDVRSKCRHKDPPPLADGAVGEVIGVPFRDLVG